MPVLAYTSPRPEAAVEAREVETGATETTSGPRYQLVFTSQIGSATVFHFDLRAMNVAAWDFEALIKGMRGAARGPFPTSVVVFVDESMAEEWSQDPLDYVYPLVADRRISAVVRRGEPPPFQWDW